MDKTLKNIIVIGIVVFVAICALTAYVTYKRLENKSNLSINSLEDLTELVNKVYEGLEIEIPMVMSQEIDVTDNDMVSYVTGLQNADDVEYVVVSEPMMSSQAYSLVLVKVKDGVDADKVAKEMNDNIDNRKWLCVTAEKVYSTSSGDVVCLVMSNEETAKAVYNNFKTLAGTVGEEYVRTEEEIELPDDMLYTEDLEIPAYDDTVSIDDQLPAADLVE